MSDLYEKLEIRIATPDDAKELLAIYAPYVRGTAISFEYGVPSVEEFRNRIETTLKEYPYLIALIDGRIVGYCYASTFHHREAYKHATEVSVYVAQDSHGMGIGRALYAKLEEMLVKQNVFLMYACTTYTDRDDDKLPKTSPQFHEHLGFKLVGEHTNCGYKFDKWYSVRWYEKWIAPRPEHPESFIPFSEMCSAW